MNTKLAKTLRRITGHHHSVSFKYTELTDVPSRSGKKPIIVDPNSTKGQYKALKKEYKS